MTEHVNKLRRPEDLSPELWEDDLDLGEIRILTEENAAALPENGASISWNSCTRPALNDA